jgi:nucleoside-diphosphate-sugar epimerase
VIKLGALSPTRDFNYVTDTAEGMMALAVCPEAEGQVVNIGSGEEWSIRQTVDLLCEILDRRVPVETDAARIRPDASEVNRLLADNRRITELTGWRSRVPFRVGLERTVRWIERNLQYFNPDVYAR